MKPNNPSDCDPQWAQGDNPKGRKSPSIVISMLPLVVLVSMLAATIHAFGSDVLGGASQVMLLAVSAFCVFVGMVFLRVPWSDFETAITHNISSVSSAIVILLLIGALSGTWMVSGVVPTLIYYGIELIHPSIFLASTCIICALVSVMTGSSWTTVATIGIALMGIGRAQGFDSGWIAGAIISGAYFGDKISPLSDTTVLASGVTDVPLFRHIRYMFVTTVPSMTLTIAIFMVAGFMLSHNGVGQTSDFSAALASRFHITPWLLAVPVLTGVMIARRMAPLVTLFLASLAAVAAGLLFQGDVLAEIDPNVFKASLQSVYGETAVHTNNAILTDLVATRGMAGMMNTVWLIICAMCFGATMAASGMIGGITRFFMRMVKGRTSLVASTVGSGVAFNLAVADQYLCILLCGNVFRDVYDRQGYERRLLSRTTEDAVTVTSVLVPWNTCGMTQSTVLGVATVAYLPYCFFNIISPLMSIIVAAVGYKIFRSEDSGDNPKK